MSEVVLKIKNVSKQYRLGLVGTGTLSHDLNRWWHLLRGKQDPYLKVGAVNDRENSGGDYIMALNNINFEVNRGDIIGIIGKNGAGKSTLLKLLSQITNPTTGSIKVKGRIAALLEVGTGFHPELTGRENIFLNGAILGMSKAEIRKKIDEIIDFSGVAKYVDTPVKRYSSGMMVRLGFAVAAHLEPEILVVDEVLAVGDAEFQKKCLGKMKDVAGQGRTVLFVSHNMPSVLNLCTKGVLIDRGEIKETGDINHIVSQYLSEGKSNHSSKEWDRKERPGNDIFKVNKVALSELSGLEVSAVKISQPLKVTISFEVIEDKAKVGFSLVLSDSESVCLFGSLNNQEKNFYSKPMRLGNYKSEIIIPGDMFNNGEYIIELIGFDSEMSNPFKIENILHFEAIDDGVLKGDYSGGYGGFFRPRLEWNTTNDDDLQ